MKLVCNFFGNIEVRHHIAQIIDMCRRIADNNPVDKDRVGYVCDQLHRIEVKAIAVKEALWQELG